MPRWVRRVLLTVTAAVVVLAVLGGALFALMQTSAAKRLLADRLETELAAATGFGVHIGRLDGFLPISATIADIRLSDIDGTWLTADRLEMAWRPAALLDGRLHVLRVVAGEVNLARQPAVSDVPPDEEPAGVDMAIFFPRLPLPIEIDEMRIDRLALAPEVLGTAAVLRATGQASLGGTVRDAALALTVARIDGTPGQAALRLGQHGTPAAFTLAIEIEEPAGGLLSRAIELPGQPLISVRLAGDGPPADWRGELRAVAGPSRLDADLAVRLDKAVRLTLEGRAEDAGRLAPELDEFIPPSIQVTTSLHWTPGQALAFERMSIAATEGTAELSGDLDVDSGRIQAQADVRISDAARWRALMDPVSLRAAHLTGSLAGSLDEPAFDLQATIEGLTMPGAAAERFEARIRGTATLLDRHLMTALPIAAEGRASGITLAESTLADLVGETATWSTRARLDLANGAIEIETARVASSESAVEAAGSIGGYGRAIDLQLRADIADVEPLAELAEIAAGGKLNLTAELSGDALAPQLAGKINGQFADFAIDEPMASRLLGPAPTIAGTVTASAETVEFETLTVHGVDAELSTGGTVSMDGEALHLNVATLIGDLAPLAEPLDMAIGGRIAARAQLTRTPDQPILRFSGTVDIEELAIDEPVALLLGPSVHLSAEGALGPAGVAVDALRIAGVAAEFAASGRIVDALELDYRLDLQRLSVLSPRVGVDLDGRLTVAGNISGPSNSPVVAGAITGDGLHVAAVPLTNLNGRISVRGVDRAPHGDVMLDLVVQPVPLSLATSYRTDESGRIAFPDLRLTAPQTVLAGDLALSPADLLEGRLRGDSGDLAWLGALIDESVAGSGILEMAFAPGERGQAVDLDATLDDLSLGPADAPLVVERLTLTAALDDAFGSLRGRAELHVADAAREDLRLRQAAVAVEGDAASWDVQATAAGAYGEPIAVDAAGELTVQDDGQHLRLDRLDGRFGEVTARLNAPTTLRRGADGIAIAGLDALVAEARLTGEGRLSAGQIDLRLALADLPLGRVSGFVPDLDLGGKASAQLDLAGSFSAPSARADIRLADLSVGGTGIDESLGIGGVVTIDLRDGRADVAGELSGPPELTLSGRATMPLAFALDPFEFDLSTDVPISGQADGRIDLALAHRIIDLGGDSLGGRLDVETTLAGTLTAPRLSGEARLADGRYVSAAVGTLLQDVTAVATGDNDRIVLRSLTAGDGGEGTLTASGSAVLGAVEGDRYAVDLALSQFAVPTGGDEAVRASGQVAVALDLMDTTADGRRHFNAGGHARDLAIDGRSLDLFGPELRMDIAGAFTAAGIEVETVHAEGPDGQFSAGGRIDESIDLDYRLELRRLAALSSLAGVDLDGSAEIVGSVAGATDLPELTGRLESPALRLAGFAIDRLTADLNARDLGGTPQGVIGLAVTAYGRQWSLATPYRLENDGALALSDLHLTAPEASLAGDLAVLPAGLLRGRVQGEIGDLGLLEPFIDRPVGGAATVDLTFAPAQQAQSLTADIALRDLMLAADGGAPVTAGQLRLTTDLSDAFGAPRGRAELQVSEVARGDLLLVRARLSAEGGRGALQLRLEGAGEHVRAFDLVATGELALEDGAQRLRLDRLDGRFGAVRMELNAPATLLRDADGMAFTALDAVVGDGRLTGEGRLDADEVDLRLSLAHLPLEIVAAFAPQVDLGGRASADLRLAGLLSSPSAQADIRLADLRVGTAEIGDVLGVAGHVTLDLRDGRADVTATFGGAPDFALDGRISAPLALALEPFAFELADAAPLAGRIGGGMDLALVPRLVDLGGDSLGGRLDVDMAVGGTLAAPRLAGEMHVADGSYESAATGAVLRDVAAIVTGDNDRVVLRSLTARDGADGRLSASGTAALSAREDARYALEIALAQFAIPTGDRATVASGHVSATFDLTAEPDGRRRFLGAADVRDLQIDGRSIDVLGPQMHAGLQGTFADTGIEIETARLEGPDGHAEASGRIDETVDLHYALQLPRLAAFSSLAGVDLDGSAEVSGSVTGGAASPDLTADLSARALRVAGVILDGANATLTAHDLVAAPQGEIDLAIAARGRQLALATPYHLQEDGALALTALRLTAPQTLLTGSLSVSPLGLLDGRMRGRVGELGILEPFVGEPIAGVGTVDLAFRPTGQGQSLTADIALHDVSLAGEGDTAVTVRQLSLTADFRDAFAAPVGRAALRIEDATTGALALERADLVADGTSGAMQLRLDATGRHGHLFQLAAAGELALGDRGQRLRLDRLDGSFGPTEVRLNAPATLSRDAGGLTLAGLDAAIGEGRVTGSGSLGSRRVDLQLALADVPLGLVTALAPNLGLDGTASADLRLAGTPAAPTAHGDIRLLGLRALDAGVGEDVALDGVIAMDLQGGRGTMSARFSGPPDFALDGQLAAPVVFRVQPLELTVPGEAPLSGRIGGRLDLAVVPRIVDLYGDSLAGRIDLDMTVGGTRAQPRLAGEARLINGGYASAEAGTVLRDIEAVVAGDNGRIRLRSLTAGDGAAGRLSAQGSAVLGGADGARYEGEVTLDHFKVLNRSDATATASGRLQLEEAYQAARLAGDVTIESAELRIPESLPPEIVRIEVEEINLPPGRQPRRSVETRSLAPPLALAVTLRIPGRAFLRGRGVDTEWRGRLNVAGTMAAPDITGRLEVVRGGVDLLGRDFEVESGTVTFVGGDKIDPELDVVATAEANEINARVHVTGVASAPEFELGSDSGLPPEEALAQLLFGQSAGSLTPAQALQLAQAAAALTGRGPGMIDRLRRGIGLDVLGVGTAGPDAADATVRAGKYIGDRVFLKVEQGLTQESRQVGVEVRVLPQVTVEGGVGQEGSGRVGVNWRYDY